jgi:hypothetical protein
MIGEIDLYGVFVSPLLIWVVTALPLTAILRTLKAYKGFPHGMPTTEADTINADLLAFIRG